MNSPRIGKCIYCGTKNPPLTREHILPKGLGGSWTLLEASCNSCSKITGKFEEDVLKKLLINTRAALGVKSRHRILPTSLPITINVGGKSVILELPIDKYGLVAYLPTFAPPAHLDKRLYKKGIDINGHVVFRVGGVNLAEYAKEVKSKSVSFVWKFSPTDFAKMLAKIAYGFSVYNNGVDYYKRNYILPSILNQQDEIGRWVGMLPEPINGPLPKEDFVINFVNNTQKEEFAQIRLFGKFADTPTYIIALGELK